MKTLPVKLRECTLGRGQFILSKVLVTPSYFLLIQSANKAIIGESPLQWLVVSPTTFRAVQFWDGKNCSLFALHVQSKWFWSRCGNAHLTSRSCLHTTRVQPCIIKDKARLLDKNVNRARQKYVCPALCLPKKCLSPLISIFR